MNQIIIKFNLTNKGNNKMTKEEFIEKMDTEYLLWLDRFKDDLKHHKTYLEMMSIIYDYINKNRDEK
jgi:hypothetical protein